MKKTLSKLPISAILIYICIGIITYMLNSKILILSSLFLFSFFFMLKYNSQMIFDLDPTPFATFLILSLYDFRTAFFYLILVLPFIDILSGRFNHFSALNFISSIGILLLFGFVFPRRLAIIFGPVLFNVFRVGIAYLISMGPQVLVASSIHGFIYFVLGSVLIYFI